MKVSCVLYKGIEFTYVSIKGHKIRNDIKERPYGVVYYLRKDLNENLLDEMRRMHKLILSIKKEPAGLCKIKL